ncbi:MAG: tetratricopeptide repeat protein, partial [Nitrospirota bacterium]
ETLIEEAIKETAEEGLLVDDLVVKEGRDEIEEMVSDAENDLYYGDGDGISLSEVKKSGEEKVEIENDEDKIKEYFTEVEVYLKYGLSSKAIEQLKLVISIDSDNINAHKQIKDIYKIEGDINNAVSECLVIAGIFEKRGDNNNRNAVLNEALNLDPENEKIRSELEKDTSSTHERTEKIEKEDEEAPAELIDTEKRDEDNNIHDMVVDAEMFLEQGLKEEAEKIYKHILHLYPENSEIRSKLESISEHGTNRGIEELGKVDEALIEEIDSVKERGGIEPEEKEISDDEYFDFSEFLKDEIEEEPETKKVDLSDIIDENFEEVFNEFQKGVQKQFGEEDYETHYNLGIAYKEMGLINEAIGEFQLSIKGSVRSIDSCSMLAACYKEKGMYEKAINEIEKALIESPDDGKNLLWLKYELALIYEFIGNFDRSLEVFREIYSVDRTLRDVSKKVEELSIRLDLQIKKEMKKDEKSEEETRKDDKGERIKRRKDRISYV